MKTRVFLLLLGAVLVLWGAGLPMVLWLGAEAPGTVTQVRRQLGDRGEAIPNRYTYTIAYEFRLPNGQMAQGHTQRVGDFFAPRDMAVGKPVRVRYLPGAPRRPASVPNCCAAGTNCCSRTRTTSAC